MIIKGYHTLEDRDNYLQVEFNGPLNASINELGLVMDITFGILILILHIPGAKIVMAKNAIMFLKAI